MFNEQLHTALILLTSDKQVCKDLADYIADNAIAKIMMLVLMEGGKYKQVEVENLKFPVLVTKFEQEQTNIKLDYKEIQNQHSGGRNPFQHRIETTYLGIRPQHAQLYVHLFQQLMEQLGIYKPSENYSLGIKDPEAMYFDKLTEEFASIMGQLRTSYNTTLLSKLSAVIANMRARAPKMSWWGRYKLKEVLSHYQGNPLIENEYVRPHILNRLDAIPIIIAPYILRKKKQKILNY